MDRQSGSRLDGGCTYPQTGEGRADRPGRSDARSADRLRKYDEISRVRSGHLLDRGAESSGGCPARTPRGSTETPQGGVAEKEEIMSSERLPLQALAAEARQLERRVAELVNAAYGLTAEE